MLQNPDLFKCFHLWTRDANEASFGAILEQKEENNLRHSIAYASRQTNDAEKKYAPTRKLWHSFTELSILKCAYWETKLLFLLTIKP